MAILLRGACLLGLERAVLLERERVSLLRDAADLILDTTQVITATPFRVRDLSVRG